MAALPKSHGDYLAPLPYSVWRSLRETGPGHRLDLVSASTATLAASKGTITWPGNYLVRCTFRRTFRITEAKKRPRPLARPFVSRFTIIT